MFPYMRSVTRKGSQGRVSGSLRAAKVISKVTFCDYDEETNSYVSLSQTLPALRYSIQVYVPGYFTVKLLRITE